MIAYHYPPMQISSGIQRTLKFSNYLQAHAWEPIVLTVHPRAYAATTGHQLAEIPEGVHVRRAFALDTRRHLAIKGRHSLWLALPDSWSSWWLGGVCSGLSLIRKFRPAVIWSTYPIATAHLIGLTLHRLTGIPWVADCRDSMTEDGYPTPPLRRKAYLWIERQMVLHAEQVVFTTSGAVRMYADRYPEVPVSRWGIIANGFDEANFTAAEDAIAGQKPAGQNAAGPMTLVHSGLLYPQERDPLPFFAAVAELKQDGLISAQSLRIRLRATGFDEQYQPLIDAGGIADIVSLEPRVDYRQALAEMLSADGLLIFQAANCNHQIPAKLYEYLRARRPVLALTDSDGDTAGVMRDAGLNTIVPLDEQSAIKAGLGRFIEQIGAGSAPVPDPDCVARYSREARTAELAALLDGVAGPG